MKYEIVGGNFPAVEIELYRGESVYTQTSGMCWMENGISMDTNLKGGILKSIGRLFTQESLFMTTYTCNVGSARIGFAMQSFGSIEGFQITPDKSLICQKSSFLVAESSVKSSVTFTKKFTAGLFGGEGFVLQKLTGNGKVFIETVGSIIEKNLGYGEELSVDNGHIVAFEESCSYEVKMVKGLRNILYSGEGLTLIKLTGPGRVYLQTMTLEDIANSLLPFIPKPENSNQK